ncbi:MAG: peptide chain release factor N(5)-glutamine methyltransferase [Bacteroidales bacterium]|nr:peptide chain release factor N(5)-glutamine methyltransferase [Bacteroidales bacterium]
MLLRDFIRSGIEALGHLYPEAEARGIILSLTENILGTRSYTHIIEPETVIAPEKLRVLESAMERLSDGEPIQYVIGRTEFCGRVFRVTPDVLIPRPETEMLCAEAIRIAAPGARILDLCTGSGCIAWTLALSVPEAHVVGIDVSVAALSVAASQERLVSVISSGGEAGAEKSPSFIQADIFGPVPSDLGQFDLSVSNPPYVLESEKAAMRRNVLGYEPELALFVPDSDPLRFYREIARWAGALLVPGGSGIVEINEALGEETAALFRDEGLVSVRILQDFFGKNRFVLFQKATV